MNFISMFSGIEAASVAFEPLGWKAICYAEFEKFPSAVLAHHYPAVPNVGDMTAHDWSQYRGRCDLVVGGPPCQAFSVAGLRQSLADDRGNLSLQYVKAVHAIDPLWCITENVPGWLSTKDNAFGCFLAGMVGEDAELLPPGGRWTDAGVVAGPTRTAAWVIKDAQYFGLPQRRRRVFVLSVRGAGNWRCAAALFPLIESLSRHSPPRRETGEGVAPTISARTKGGGGLGTDFDCDGGLIAGTLNANGKAAGSATTQDAECGLLVAYGQNNTSGPVDVSNALQAHPGPAGRLDFGSETFLVGFSAKDHGADAGPISPTLRSGNHDKSHANGGVMPAVVIPLDMRQASRGATMTNNRAEGSSGGAPGTGIGQAGDPSPTVAASHVPAIAFESRFVRNGRGAPDTIVPPLKAQSGQSGKGDAAPLVAFTLHGADKTVSTATETDIAGSIRTKPPGSIENSSTTAVMQSSAVRRLTPRECERLQGFPDDWTLVPYRGKPASDGPRYKSLGNSFAVPVVRWIGQRIQMVENLCGA